MSKKSKFNHSPNNNSSIVYSTHPEQLLFSQEEKENIVAPADQALRIILETKHRAGKTVTIVYGFEGSEEALNELSKALKNHCGTGGSVKEGEIIIQGDHRQKIFQYLKQKGYQKTKL